jgi:hypothetical protein
VADGRRVVPSWFVTSARGAALPAGTCRNPGNAQIPTKTQTPVRGPTVGPPSLTPDARVLERRSDGGFSGGARSPSAAASHPELPAVLFSNDPVVLFTVTAPDGAASAASGSPWVDAWTESVIVVPSGVATEVGFALVGRIFNGSHCPHTGSFDVLVESIRVE